MTAECTLVVAVCTKKDYNTVTVVGEPLSDQNWVSGREVGRGVEEINKGSWLLEEKEARKEWCDRLNKRKRCPFLHVFVIC